MGDLKYSNYSCFLPLVCLHVFWSFLLTEMIVRPCSRARHASAQLTSHVPAPLHRLDVHPRRYPGTTSDQNNGPLVGIRVGLQRIGGVRNHAHLRASGNNLRAV